MLVRIVKMSFEPSKVGSFLANFDSNKQHIRNFEGCTHLELYRDTTQQNVFFTYSHWNTETDLERYRQSDLFKSVWAKTKILFNNKPEAWSVDTVHRLP
ncbi:MAG TPA: antibiotic biosynthesis monooxygenase [Aquaticitalea sp.]|nr:antibiotic biosynthesis monooxygenase [Aquaticitalea sp.]HNU58702.1 antibiotic biosynthesis monooxygenase [Aquaticitalea sp.]